MTKEGINKLNEKIKQFEKELGELRDNIQDTINELDHLHSVSNRAYDALVEARETLSELV